MPFQSEKQRRYMHANLPDIANRWEAKYGLGGVAGLNAQLNSLPEYYMPFPAAHGGLIPAHEAGIYGLAEGGNIRLQPHTATDLLVQKTSTGERPKYQPPGGGATSLGSGRDAPGSDRGPRDAPDRHGPVQTVTTTTPEPDGRTQALINISQQKKKDIYEGTDLEEQREIDERIALRRLQQGNISKQERKNLEVGLGLREAKPKSGFWGTMGNIALSMIPGLLPAKLATTWNIGKLGWDITKTDRYDRYFELAGINKNEWLSKIGSVDDSKRDLYESFADTPNHPERIALQAELEIGKKTPTDVPDRDGVTQETSITIDNIEEVNDAKTQLLRKYEEMNEASRLAWERQQQMNRDKQMAYYRMMMKPYFTGAAQGGRIPGGYNTGGLSNLFKLKNR